jgi:hypothetical protein
MLVRPVSGRGGCGQLMIRVVDGPRLLFNARGRAETRESARDTCAGERGVSPKKSRCCQASHNTESTCRVAVSFEIVVSPASTEIGVGSRVSADHGSLTLRFGPVATRTRASCVSVRRSRVMRNRPAEIFLILSSKIVYGPAEKGSCGELASTCSIGGTAAPPQLISRRRKYEPLSAPGRDAPAV